LEAIPLKRAVAAVGGDRRKNEYAALAFLMRFGGIVTRLFPTAQEKVKSFIIKKAGIKAIKRR
jgi:hypothetical protein